MVNLRIKKGVEVSQRCEFSCSYLVPQAAGYDLNSIHYRFEATVCGSSPYLSTGRVISFEEFKKLIKSVIPDKAFIYDSTDENQRAVCEALKNCGIFSYAFSGEISTEKLLEEISLMLDKALDAYPGVYLKETKLRENANSYATWNQEVKSNGI